MRAMSCQRQYLSTGKPIKSSVPPQGPSCGNAFDAKLDERGEAHG
jgi:hypothetical protein